MECGNDTSERSAVLAVGATAPDLALADARGGRHHLTDFRGSPVVLVVHGPQWNPMLDELVGAYNRVVAGIRGGMGRAS